MALDRYKTQVLLLHSEQSTLDKFSTGFDDRYTVHCATTGTEALVTLGETPIHVIVSAQKLPGMSGAEALREARKRSPETIGILLAGDSTEALVGEKEVFQVIRGGVDPSELRRLIDNATQQSRLITLAESANDNRANPDEPVSEHIIMETSENGSSIITDATGQLPALDPRKVSPSGAVGAATVDVLVITKDQEFLTTIKESSRGAHSVHYANTLKQAEEAVRKNKVGVAVIDAAMVGDNVEKLAGHLRNLRKRLVAIVAGRRDDGEMLMDLINRGKVYRFLLKPVSPGRARLAVEASVKHHLEAPDSAFRTTGKAAAPAVQKAKPQPPPAKAAPAKSAATKPQPADGKQAQAAPSIAARKGESLSGGRSSLDDAFGDDAGFTETMTGIVSTVTKSLSSKKDREPKKDASAPPAAAPGDDGDTSSFLNPKTLGIGAAALVAAAAIGFWVFGGSEDATVSKPRPAAASSVTESSPDFGGSAAQPSVNVDDLLEEARLARDAGQIFDPPGNNAIELYMTAVSAAPDNAYAAAELDATLDEALAMAESALLERRAGEAAAALERVRQANPDHPRLPFLSAQVSQMQLRDYIDSARSAIREQRLEDASAAIAGARALGIVGDGEIDAVEEELRNARSERRVDEVLALAGQKLDEGALTTPANDNARYYYQLALSNDPGNAAAQTGLTVVASKIVLQAREEIDGGRFSTAEALLAEARQLDPQSAELAASTRALAEARQRVEEDRRRAERERRAEAERQQAEKRAEEERQAAEQRAAEAAAAAAAAATATAADASPADATSAEADAADAAEPVAEESAAPPPAEAAEPVPVREQTPVAASTLTRKKYVAPRYPRSAERRNISGWVDVVFTVAADGSVADIEIIGSEPGDTFVDAATRAVEKWEFEPVVENGQVVEKRAGVRMMFALE
ncbi:MAG TPA: TonB family protein [Woeseiaceae bacterium]|nr:TonB family protein [Woeseiaceae bacterium]